MLEARSLEELPGGREGFDRAHGEIAAVAELAQQRLSDALDAIGPPGSTRWDPISGEVELRDRAFRAEQLGSFDGVSWLWSWANEHLNIPPAKTAVARRLRERGGAFAEPMIAEADERLPYMMGDFAIAHCGVEAYWIANQSQVYVFEPGQLVVPRLRRLALCFVSKTITLDAVRALLSELSLQPAADDALEVEGDGLTVRITRLERLEDVMRAAAFAMPEAKQYGCVLVVETHLEPWYTGTRYGTTMMDMWAPEAFGDFSPDANDVSGDLRPTVSGPWVAAEALLVCERLNSLPGSLLWDAVLHCDYPKGEAHFVGVEEI